MSIDYTKYETVIGLEIHVQLNTLSKAYCSDSTLYGSAPNTHISPISLGHPGTLPVSNSKVLESAIKLGIALNCSIRERNEYARKNYFYADLPKGYQITQDKTPICNGGYIEITDQKDQLKKINITRIHIKNLLYDNGWIFILLLLYVILILPLLFTSLPLSSTTLI